MGVVRGVGKAAVPRTQSWAQNKRKEVLYLSNHINGTRVKKIFTCIYKINKQLRDQVRREETF